MKTQKTLLDLNRIVLQYEDSEDALRPEQVLEQLSHLHFNQVQSKLLNTESKISR